MVKPWSPSSSLCLFSHPLRELTLLLSRKVAFLTVTSRAIAIPKPFRQYMLDRSSPLLNFYPEQWEVDPNGKQQEWKWILKLPFVNLKQLFSALNPVWEKAENWTAEEKERNKVGSMYLMSHKDNQRFNNLLRLNRDPRLRKVSGNHSRLPANANNFCRNVERSLTKKEARSQALLHTIPNLRALFR